MAAPLDPSRVTLLLALLAPPSQLCKPLPAQLLSNALLQRHHFLQLSPADDVPSYLCWPSSPPQSNAAVVALDNLHWTMDPYTPPSWSIRYTHDGECFFAHAAATTGPDGPRIVFLWSENEWKYHDLGLMPFPAYAVERLADLQSTAVEHNTPVSVLQDTWSVEKAMAPADDATDGDGYWGLYDTQADDNEIARDIGTPDQSSAPLDLSEDAYWARYTSVQGSGDSTQPSPKPNDAFRKLPLQAGNGRLRDALLMPPPVLRPVFDEARLSVLDGSTAGILDIRLEHLRAEDSTLQSRDSFLIPSPTNSVLEDKNLPSSSITHSEPRSTVSSRSIAVRSLRSGSTSEHNLSPVVSETPVVQSGYSSHAVSLHDNEDVDVILRAAVKGLFRLWRLGHKGTVDPKTFLQIASQAVEEL